MESFSTNVASVASGTDKTMLNVFKTPATPTTRAAIYEILLGSVATPADAACNFILGRTTAVGTEGSGYAPNNLDPGGPAGECDSGLGVFSVEPTYTANKELLRALLNQRATYRHQCMPGREFKLPATQNNGAGLKAATSTGTQAHGATIFFFE